MCACVSVKDSSWIWEKKNIDAVVKGRMPAWKEIAWQLEKLGSPLVGCMVRVGVIACPCFRWAVWTCPQNTWHTCNDFLLCLGPSWPPTLVVPSLTCVQNTYDNYPQPPWETVSSLQAGTEEKPIRVTSTSSVCDMVGRRQTVVCLH